MLFLYGKDSRKPLIYLYSPHVPQSLPIKDRGTPLADQSHAKVWLFLVEDMAVQIKLSDAKEVTRKLKALKGESETALQKVVNDFKKRSPAWIAKDITATYNIKQKEAKGSMNSSGNGLDATININGRPLTFSHFGLKPKNAPNKKSYSVSVEVKKGNRETLERLTTFLYNGTAFSRRDESGKIVGRITGSKGQKRNYMRPLYSLSVPQMAENEEVSDKIREDINKNLLKRAEHYLERYLGK